MKHVGRRSEIPPMEIAGNSRILVGCCEGILEYEPETVKLRAGKRMLRISGMDLDLCNLTENTVLIRGILDSVAFED
ncbi:MAG: YabP/YqfC family sporulation protein [Clostridia bacterium]|nr:YabP/YqfC family sporulation protein [Clostridia bacterium]MBQ4322681.1 YabP/YqfC family sporulation protein [Clostridia bacterium]